MNQHWHWHPQMFHIRLLYISCSTSNMFKSGVIWMENVFYYQVNSYLSVFVLKYMSDKLFSLHVVKFARLNTKIEIQLLNFNCIILTHQKKKKKTGKTRDLPVKHGPYNFIKHMCDKYVTHL